MAPKCHCARRSFEHKFGIEIISFIDHQSHPARHISLRLTELIYD